jgi:DNA-binding GntR family transcriptional regulator
LGFTKAFQRRQKLELARVKGGLQMFEEQALEQARQHADGQEKAGAAGDPTLTVWADAAARHHTMHVGVVKQALSPGVKYREEANFSA